MTAQATNPYLKTRVLTASPAELRLMLLDGAIRFLQQGAKGLADRDYEASYEGISRCQNILIELINGLDPSHAPELCERLSGLYTFMYTRLVAASMEKDEKICIEVLKLLEYERETWTLLMDQLAAENRAGAATAARVLTDTPAASLPSGGHTLPAGLIGGQISVRG